MTEDKAPAVEVNENALTPDTVTKYTSAADVTNKTLAGIVELCVPGASIGTIVADGRERLTASLASLYAKKKDVRKGTAFPVCVSTGSAMCHVAEGGEGLSNGDLVRIELGAHIDGYAAMAAHSLVVGASKENPVTGRKADLLSAAHYATEAALRLMRPGKTNFDVTEVIAKVADEYGVKPVQGMQSYQLLRNNIAGADNKRIILNPNDVLKKETKSVEFEEGDVFSLDIVLTTNSEGVHRPSGTETHRTSVFRKTDTVYGLKTTAARTAYSIIKKDFGEFPFSIGQFEDEIKARLGLVECEKYGLVEPYRVVYDKEGEESVHVILTVLLMPSGPLKVTGLPWDRELVKSEKEIKDEGLKELLKTAVRSTNKKKKKATAAQE